MSYAESTNVEFVIHYKNMSNILKILPPKNEYFQIKNSDILHISAQNIDCGYSLELPWWSMFLSRNKKNNVYPCKPLVLLYKSRV